MRTRKDILEDQKFANNTHLAEVVSSGNLMLITEILLDIRDLLTTSKEKK